MGGKRSTTNLGAFLLLDGKLPVGSVVFVHGLENRNVVSDHRLHGRGVEALLTELVMIDHHLPGEPRLGQVLLKQQGQALCTWEQHTLPYVEI